MLLWSSWMIWSKQQCGQQLLLLLGLLQLQRLQLQPALLLLLGSGLAAPAVVSGLQYQQQ